MTTPDETTCTENAEKCTGHPGRVHETNMKEVMQIESGRAETHPREPVAPPATSASVAGELRPAVELPPRVKIFEADRAPAVCTIDDAIAYAERYAAAAKLVPGVMRCAKCSFQLNRVTLYVGNGAIGAGDNKTEPCPNGCGPLWPVTWKQWADEAYEYAAAETKRADALQARVAELEADNRRIEWLSLHPRGASIVVDGVKKPCVFWGLSSAPDNTLRQAIDAAILAERGETEVGDP